MKYLYSCDCGEIQCYEKIAKDRFKLLDKPACNICGTHPKFTTAITRVLRSLEAGMKQMNERIEKLEKSIDQQKPKNDENQSFNYYYTSKCKCGACVFLSTNQYMTVETNICCRACHEPLKLLGSI